MSYAKNLPRPLYRADQIRGIDRLAIEQCGIPAATLMERAGVAAFRLLRLCWPRAREIVVVCGPGNNGGDGYVVARLAHQAGMKAVVLSLSEKMSTTEADAMRRRYADVGGTIQRFDGTIPSTADVIVDAILGIGAVRELQEDFRLAVSAINASARPVLALDIPSGLNAGSGAVLGEAVRAEATLVFIGMKLGVYTAHGRDCVGDVYFDDLAVPPDAYKGIPPVAHRLMPEEIASWVTPRARDSHKGSYGKVLIVGGDVGMPGAVRLAGEAAYRVGAGLVAVATHPAHAANVNAARPELLVYGVDGANELEPLVHHADVVAIGPGLGQGEWGSRLLTHILDKVRAPLVLDADALNLLALDPVRRDGWVLTPHPGEAARLLGTTTETVQRQRLDAAHAISDRYGGVCVLKGAGTIVTQRGREVAALCDRGNPGLASAGTGDVLTGVIAGLLAQGLEPYHAACAGVWLHAVAGDMAATDGEIGLIASDLFPYLRGLMNDLTRP